MNGTGARGLVLVLIAVAIGAFILQQGFDGDGTTALAGNGEQVDTEATAEPSDPPADDPAAPVDGTADDGNGEDDTAVDDGTVDPAPEEGTTTPEPPTNDPARLPADVKVVVANGAQLNGVAGALTERIGAVGYVTLSPDNAEPTNDSAIYYKAGAQADAAAVAEILNASDVQQLPLPGDGTVPGNVDLRDADVYILIGSNPSPLLPG